MIESLDTTDFLSSWLSDSSTLNTLEGNFDTSYIYFCRSSFCFKSYIMFINLGSSSFLSPSLISPISSSFSASSLGINSIMSSSLSSFLLAGSSLQSRSILRLLFNAVILAKFSLFLSITYSLSINLYTSLIIGLDFPLYDSIF